MTWEPKPALPSSRHGAGDPAIVSKEEFERGIERQVANLKAEDTTPALRRRIADRITGLEEALEELRQRATALAREAADAPPTPADLATALDRLTLLNEELSELPQPNLRVVFDSLHLQLAFQPAAQAVDVELTLIADEPPDRNGKIAQVWSVPPAGIEPATRGLGNLASMSMEYDWRTFMQVAP